MFHARLISLHNSISFSQMIIILKKVY